MLSANSRRVSRSRTAPEASGLARPGGRKSQRQCPRGPYRCIIEAGVNLAAIHGDEPYRARRLTWEEYRQEATTSASWTSPTVR